MAFVSRVSGRQKRPFLATSTPALPTVTDSLTLAMVAVSDAPLLLLDGDLRVIAVSNSFCTAFHIDPASAPGRSLFDLGTGEWNLPKLKSLLTATASGMAAVPAYEIDLADSGRDLRRLIIKAQKLVYLDTEITRLLVTVTDVTDARAAEQAKDDLLRDKGVLLQEVQHRVANSLQIIASVLMQTARKVQSEETRSYLNDAHNRVMSIATVQQQLAANGAERVALKPYFTQLCLSLGASMIRDHDKQHIEVTGDDSIVGADTSVSLGLIVTELVINALKHAFPDGRAGKILVDYRAQGPNWTLTVSDNGVGMSAAPTDTKAGLGTFIVEALARQQHGLVKVMGAHPGTTVTIVHNQIAAVPAGQAV